MYTCNLDVYEGKKPVNGRCGSPSPDPIVSQRNNRNEQTYIVSPSQSDSSGGKCVER